MNATEVLALIAVTALILQHVAQIPTALAGLLRACLPVIYAARELTAAIANPEPEPLVANETSSRHRTNTASP